MGTWAEEEFWLPDSPNELAAARDTLLDTLMKKQADYYTYQTLHPKDNNPERSAEYYAVLVALRRWQFAYHKFKQKTGGRVPSSA